MELSRILIRELVDYQIIELREVVDDEDDTLGEARTFPIVIGLPEAQAIERRLSGVKIKRPQTHDLLADVVERLGGELEAIAITDLNDHTFYAVLKIRGSDGELIEVDSRPSDAIALGIAGDIPIFVDDAVIAQATTPDFPDQPDFGDQSEFGGQGDEY